VPLSEATELYVVEIWDALYADCARVFETPQAFTTYLASEQVADFGDEQAHIYFTIAQVGAVGIGPRARGVAIGNGSTDDDVLVPVTPFGG